MHPNNKATKPASKLQNIRPVSATSKFWQYLKGFSNQNICVRFVSNLINDMMKVPFGGLASDKAMSVMVLEKAPKGLN